MLRRWIALNMAPREEFQQRTIRLNAALQAAGHTAGFVFSDERAPTIATTIHTIVRQPGKPFAASSAAVSAKGSAKIECSHLIISSVVRVFIHKLGILGSHGTVYWRRRERSSFGFIGDNVTRFQGYFRELRMVCPQNCRDARFLYESRKMISTLRSGSQEERTS